MNLKKLYELEWAQWIAKMAYSWSGSTCMYTNLSEKAADLVGGGSKFALHVLGDIHGATFIRQ